MKKNKFNNYINKNIDDIPLTDIDYEGVIYEDSRDSKTNNVYKKNITSNKKSYSKPHNKVKKAQNFNYSKFLIGAISLGSVICLVVFFLTYNYISDYFSFDNNTVNSSNLQENNNLNNNTLSILDEISENTVKNVIGIIKDINLETEIVQLFDISLNKNYALKIIGSTELKDQYDAPLSLIEFANGDIVNFSFDSSNKITYMKKYNNTFYEENISNYTIDATNRILNFNNKSYSLSKNLIILKNSEEINLENINPLNVLDIKGIDNTIYYIEIKKGVGKVKFTNIPKLSNATIEIDRNIFKPLSKVDSINLEEGTHKIVIRADNITPFVKEITVLDNNETVVDLSELQSKKGTVFIKSNVSDYTLYINNTLETSREPLLLNYGAYTIRAEKEGYSPFETQISVNSSNQTIEINLEKIEKLGELTISSNPSEAQVFVNNAFIGYTPLNYKLPYGTHNVVLKKEGYLDFNLSSINIGKDDSVFNITMHKNSSTTTETTTSSEQKTTSETTTSSEQKTTSETTT